MHRLVMRNMIYVGGWQTHQSKIINTTIKILFESQIPFQETLFIRLQLTIKQDIIIVEINLWQSCDQLIE